MPCFNQGQYLEESIGSILLSGYNNLEIVIIDDGSTDNSETVALSLANKFGNIRYYKQQNQGPSVARNRGISLCTGEYILPVDADDRIAPNYISEAVKVLDSNPTIKVVYCEAEYFGDKTGKWELPAFSLRKLARKNMIFACSMYRKSDWERINGYAEEMTWGFEDWEFWISMLKNGGEVKKLPFTGFYYRIKKVSRRKGVKKEGKIKTIAFLNHKHKDFIYRQLGGPLRFQRKLSSIINLFSKK